MKKLIMLRSLCLFIVLLFLTRATIASPTKKRRLSHGNTPETLHRSKTFVGEEAGSKSHQRRVIAASRGKQGNYGDLTVERGRRFSRYTALKKIADHQLLATLEYWLPKYVQLRNNFGGGMQGERDVRKTFKISNKKTPIKVTLESKGEDKDFIEVTTIPDGVSEEHKIILEVKTIRKPKEKFYDLRQIRAQRAEAKRLGYSHYLVFVCTFPCSPDNFIKPSSPLSESQTKIRLYDHEGKLFRWKLNY